eukprot:691759-Hanusia_phi.AAC.1
MKRRGGEERFKLFEAEIYDMSMADMRCGRLVASAQCSLKPSAGVERQSRCSMSFNQMPMKLSMRMVKMVLLLLLLPSLQTRSEQVARIQMPVRGRIMQLRGWMHACRGGSDWQSDAEIETNS